MRQYKPPEKGIPLLYERAGYVRSGCQGIYQVFGILFNTDAVPGEYIGVADIGYDTTSATSLHAIQAYSINVTPAVTVPQHSKILGVSPGLAG